MDDSKKDKYAQPKLINPLEKLLFKKVQVITTDGRVLIGILKGLDQALNSVLSECIERIFSTEKGVQIEKYGLYVLRGDSVAMIGEIDEETDQQLNLENIRAEPLKPITN